MDDEDGPSLKKLRNGGIESGIALLFLFTTDSELHPLNRSISEALG